MSTTFFAQWAGETGTDAKKQVLYVNEQELIDNNQSAENYGIQAHSVLVLDTLMDAIVLVDIKCGRSTLFAMDRDDVVEKSALTPHQNNKLDFSEAAKDSATRDKILKALKESPKLGFAPQVVVERLTLKITTSKKLRRSRACGV